MHASEDLTAWTGGWGQSVASNLTPDPATGIGMRYTEAKFVQTMRTGKKPEGVQIMPPMPVDVYVNMKDDDLEGHLRVPSDYQADPERGSHGAGAGSASGGSGSGSTVAGADNSGKYVPRLTAGRAARAGSVHENFHLCSSLSFVALATFPVRAQEPVVGVADPEASSRVPTPS